MVIRTLKILAGLLVYENLPQIQSKLFQCNDLPLFVLFFRGNSRITIQFGSGCRNTMLGHFDAGFTLCTYTHVTRQMQESAAEKMGNFMAQMM